jgi:hypothetical protein
VYKIQEIPGYRAAPFSFISYPFIVDHFLQLTCAVLFYCRRYFLLALFFYTILLVSTAVPFLLIKIMGRKCCVRGCKSNYALSTAKNNIHLKIKNDQVKANQRNIKMFGLPIALEERKVWFKSIPNLTEEVVNNLKTNPAMCQALARELPRKEINW